MLPVILGSESPRRKEILQGFTLPIQQAASGFDETSIPYTGDPDHYVCTLAKEKAKALQNKYPEHIIVTADTIVVRNGKLYGKQNSETEAAATLAELSGCWHDVFTGVSVSRSGTFSARSEKTAVLFNPLTPEQIACYVKSGHWKDKAGGYGIQICGGILVNKIDGCYFNVLGLPLNTLRTLLHQVDIELWDYVC